MSNSNKPLHKSVTTSPEQDQPVGTVTAISSSTTSSVLASSKSEATKTGIVTGSVGLSKLLSSSSSSTNKGPKVPTKNVENVSWSAKQDESLINAVLDVLELPTERDEGGSDEEKEAEGGEDDWDFIDWDSIAVSVSGKTPVQCLKRYLKLKKTHNVAKAPHATPSINVDSSSSSSQPYKRKLTISTIQQSEEITLSPPKKKKESVKWSEDELSMLQTLTEQHSSCEFSFSNTLLF